MHMLPRSTPGQGKQNRVRALLAGRRLRCRRRRGRAIATIMARLTGTATATALLALVGRTLATTVLTRIALVASGAARSLGSCSPAVSRTTARDLDLAIRDLIGHGGHRGLLLRARRVATARTRGALILAMRLAALIGRRIGARASLGSSAGLASGCGTEGVLALLARQMTATTACGIHATTAILLLRLLSLALACAVLADGCGLAGIGRARALAATTAAGGLLDLGRLGLATALTATAALALALTGTGIGISITATALGHRRAGQTVGT